MNVEADEFYIGNQIYDLETGESLREYAFPEALPENCGLGGPTTSDGNLIFTVGYYSWEGKVCVIDAQDYHLVRTIDVIPSADYNLTVAGMLLTSDGRRLLIATTMGTMEIYQVVK